MSSGVEHPSKIRSWAPRLARDLAEARAEYGGVMARTRWQWMVNCPSKRSKPKSNRIQAHSNYQLSDLCNISTTIPHQQINGHKHGKITPIDANALYNNSYILHSFKDHLVWLVGSPASEPSRVHAPKLCPLADSAGRPRRARLAFVRPRLGISRVDGHGPIRSQAGDLRRFRRRDIGDLFVGFFGVSFLGIWKQMVWGGSRPGLGDTSSASKTRS